MAIGDVESVVELRRCKTCAEEKPLDQFRVCKHRTGPYRQRACIDCTRAVWRNRMRQYSKTHSTEIAAARKKRLNDDPSLLERSRQRDRKRPPKYFEAKRAREKARRLKYPEKVRMECKTSWLKNTYGLTADDVDRMRLAQGGKCAVCGSGFDCPGVVMCIDHCHKTQKVRGLLCRKCNSALGLLGDDLEVVRSAVLYLSRFLGEESAD